MPITPGQFRKLVKSGRVFSVTFIKRGDGSTRYMKCRVGVRAYLKGGDMSYRPAEKGLVTVFDMEKCDYRSVPVEGIIRVRIDGIDYQGDQG
jgi:hypothetical protein